MSPNSFFDLTAKKIHLLFGQKTLANRGFPGSITG
jgi:hypothetical protein